MEKVDSRACLLGDVLHYDKQFPHGYFSAHRGLRQGDPLSSFVITIVGEAHNRMLTVAGEANLISDFLLAASAPMVTHLHFADDTIIFVRCMKSKLRMC